jgi:hypothetical protein
MVAGAPPVTPKGHHHVLQALIIVLEQGWGLEPAVLIPLPDWEVKEFA